MIMNGNSLSDIIWAFDWMLTLRNFMCIYIAAVSASNKINQVGKYFVDISNRNARAENI